MLLQQMLKKLDMGGGECVNCIHGKKNFHEKMHTNLPSQGKYKMKSTSRIENKRVRHRKSNNIKYPINYTEKKKSTL